MVEPTHCHPTLTIPSQAKLVEIEAAIRRRSIDKLADELVGLAVFWMMCSLAVYHS